MKNLIITLVTFISILFSSCQSDVRKELAKTWRVTDIKTEFDLADTMKEAMLLSSTMQFTTDGQYTTSGGIGADQGNYTLDEDGKTLSTISAVGGNSAVFVIEDLSEKEMVIVKNGTTYTCASVETAK